MAATVELQSLCSSGADDEPPPPSLLTRAPSAQKASSTYVLEFQNLVYAVKPKRRGSSRLTILHGVSGRCEAGRLLALMGASGAGKTTMVPSLPAASVCQHLSALSRLRCRPDRLGMPTDRPGHSDAQLDVLSANASGGSLHGTITLNGLPRRPAEYRKLCCYVMQRDVLLESATVRRLVTARPHTESLLLSASLALCIMRSSHAWIGHPLPGPNSALRLHAA